jgi:hypothetical protein
MKMRMQWTSLIHGVKNVIKNVDYRDSQLGTVYDFLEKQGKIK